MNFVADESVDAQVVLALRGDGHEVISIAENDPGIADESVLSLSHQAQAILLTADKDFGELVFRRGRLHCGVLLYRLAGQSSSAKAALVVQAVQQHQEELKRQTFCVLTPRTLRVRARSR